MKLIDFLLANQVPLDLKNYKVHLATSDTDPPLQAFFDGWFQEWQEWQKQRNWSCKHIVSLIKLAERDRWLFAGVWDVLGHDWIEEKNHYRYRTALVPGHEEWIGRVIVKHERGGRASYLWGAEDGGAFALLEIRAERMRIEEFPGFNWARVPYAKLKTIVTQEVPSWKHALSNVKGIYLITDTHTGKQYVGKADGESGIWQRWCCYMAIGHGGNKDLRELLGNNSEEYLQHFQFSILEIADFQTSDQEIDGRESHWKDVLQTRKHGYNSN
ncbi:MAG: GIY-YIG nuclease family protein [Flavobacteriales bacterium]|nr:GIY-YIG nuclease family protein [Flavobacteriales bacterium]